jgi:hypothetical protein
MSDIKAILKKVKPVQAEAKICLDGELFRDRDRVQEELDALDGWESTSLSDVDPRTKAQAILAAIEQKMRDETQTFTFKSIGDKASSDLLAQHPSPKNDKGEDKYAFDPATYPVALVAAASVDPLMSPEDAEALFDILNLAQRNALFNTAYAANTRGLDIPFLPPASEPAGSTETK